MGYCFPMITFINSKTVRHILYFYNLLVPFVKKIYIDNVLRAKVSEATTLTAILSIITSNFVNADIIHIVTRSLVSLAWSDCIFRHMAYQLAYYSNR